MLSDHQNAALKTLREWDGRGVFWLAGFAGTGKTTMIPSIIEALETRFGKEALCVTPTGKARKVLSRKLNEAGMTHAPLTCHQAMYRPVLETRGKAEILAGFEHADDPPMANCTAVVVDEASMVNEEVATDIARFGKPIVAIGDDAQLPPVEGGWGLMSGRPNARLVEIHRQASESPILRLSKHVRETRSPIVSPGFVDGERLYLMRRSRNSDIPERHDLRSAKCIVGTHSTRFGITKGQRGSAPFVPVEGEPLLVDANSKLRGWVNGTELTSANNVKHRHLGTPVDLDDCDFATPLTIDVIDDDGNTMPGTPFYPRCVLAHMRRSKEIYRGPRGHKRSYLCEECEGSIIGGVCVLCGARLRRDAIPVDEIEEIDFGWVLTAHKAQGSEWNDVVVVNEARSFREHAWRWLYTAVTRARERLWVYQ